MTAQDTGTDQVLALDVLLRDGGIAQLRPLTAPDREALTELNSRVSLRTRRLRYFSVSEQPGSWYVDQVLQSAEAHHALVGIVDGSVVGLASFARLESQPETADLALLIDDDHQKQGLGALLLEHLAALARAQGIAVFTADVLLDNTRMVHLLRASGFQVTSHAERGVVELRINLMEQPELWDAVLRRDQVSETASLGPVLRPASIALVGSTREGSVASHINASLLRGGYTGRLDRLGRGSRLVDLPEVPDLVVIAVPAAAVLPVARDAAVKGAKGLLVISAGFAESGPTGEERQSELLRVCRDHGMRLVGPNCLGIVNTDPAVNLNATFCDAQPRPGSMALISQSGAVGIAALRHAELRGAGLSLFVSTGNKADVSGNDLLTYLQDDERTNVIALYLESFGNARKFARLARRVGRSKPVVVVKAGRSAAGAAAGLSHTAAAATPEVAIEALLYEAGVIRADDLDELFDIVSVLSTGRLPGGSHVAVIGNSGGPGVLAADACQAAGLILAELLPSTCERLTALLPEGASAHNPVDLLATVGVSQFVEALELVMSDPGVDSVVAIYTPLVRDGEEGYAQAMAQAQTKHPSLPLVGVLPGLASAPAGLDGVPFFEFPERAVAAIGRAATYAARRHTPEADAVPTPTHAAETARAVLDGHTGSSPWLTPTEANALLTAYGIPCARVIEVNDPQAAQAAADSLGYPVAVKASGPTVVHKADVGGLALGLTSALEVHQAYLELAVRLGAAMTGALVQRMHTTTDGLELIAGLTVDPDVGPLLLVGAGGTFTDLLDDRIVRVPPISRAQAVEQLSTLRCAARFGGYRNLPSLDLDGTCDVLLALSALARDLPQVRELDLNPLLVGHVGVTALDVRVRIGPTLDHRELPARTLTR